MKKILYDELLEKAKKAGIKRLVVGAVIKHRARTLLLRRKAEDFMGGIYELPSGQVKRQESLHDALTREVKEETNLKLRKIKYYLGHFDYKSRSGRKTRQLNFAVDVHSAHQVKLTEHDHYAWVHKSRMNNYPITAPVRKILKVEKKK